MIKKILTMSFIICLAVVATACSQRSDTKTEISSAPASVSESISSSIQSTVSEPSTSLSEDPSSHAEPASNDKYDNASIVASVKDIMQQYKDGAVDTETGAPGASAPSFDKKPDDLVFPDIKDESDLQSVEPIKGFEDNLIIKINCSDDYVMQIRVDIADNYKVTSVIFFG